MNRYDVSIIRDLLASGRNIVEWVREQEGSEQNSAAALLYAYDAQAGSYVAALSDPGHRALKHQQAAKLAGILDEFKPGSILDAGTGEATTFGPTLAAMRVRPQRVLGFDISLSRLLHGRAFLRREGLAEVELFAAALDRIPLPDNSVDVVVTCHAVEPNHGRERVILAELFRVAARALVMVEPSWEFASAEVRARMAQHGYVRHLPDEIERLGHRVIRHEPWGLDVNPRNPAALIVVAKDTPVQVEPDLVSPISRKPLVRSSESLFCPQDGHIFPIVHGVPSLLIDSAVLCSQFDRF